MRSNLITFMKINESTSYLFYEISNRYRLDFERAMADIGLHGGQVFVLQLLFIQNGQSQVELAAKLKVTPPTINNMVKSLIVNCFVNCEKCSDDGRVMRVYLAEKARNLEYRINSQWMDFDDRFFSALTGTEKLVMFQLLEKLKVID
jgi:DNA-binding MarR family transcriptional regulator